MNTTLLTKTRIYTYIFIVILNKSGHSQKLKINVSSNSIIVIDCWVHLSTKFKESYWEKEKKTFSSSRISWISFLYTIPFHSILSNLKSLSFKLQRNFKMKNSSILFHPIEKLILWSEVFQLICHLMNLILNFYSNVKYLYIEILIKNQFLLFYWKSLKKK